MIFIKSISNILRSKPKVILFFFLILLLTIILSLSLGVCVSTQGFLDQCNENYTTVAILEYMSTSYPDISIYDENMQKAVSEADFSIIEDNDNVLLWDRSARALGYVDGLDRVDPKKPLNEYGVLIVKDLNPNIYHDYWGIIVKSLSSDEESEAAILVFMSCGKEEYVPDPDRIYAIHGKFSRGVGAYPDIITKPFFHDAAKLAGITEGTDYMICDITDQYNEQNQINKDNVFCKIAQTYNVTSNSVNVFAVNDINSVYEFNQQQLYLTKGRLFREDEHREGKNVCIVSPLFAKRYGVDIGDKIPLSVVLTANTSYYESYWAENEFASSGHYEVVGITNDTKDYNFNIYIPKNSDIDYTINQVGYTLGTAIIDNDGAADFYNEVAHKLPDRMRLTIYDQGYSSVVTPFKDILRVSKIIAVISIITALTIIVFFGFIFVYRQRDVSDTMIKLGAGKIKVCRYFLYSTFIISVFAAISGIWISHLMSGYVTNIVKSIADNYTITNMSFGNGGLALTKEFVFNNQISDSFLIYMGAIVVFCSLLSCLFFTFATFNKRSRKKKKNIIRKRKGHTSTIRITTLKYSMLSIARGNIRTVVIPIFAFTTVLLLSQLVYTSNEYQAELSNITENAVISGHFTDINGKTVDRVPMEAYHMKDLYNSELIEDFNISRISKYAYCGKKDRITGEFIIEPFEIPDSGFALEEFLEYSMRGPNLIYSTSIAASPYFYYSTSVKTEFLEGYDVSILSQPIDENICCMVTTDFMEKKNINLGDTIRISDGNAYLLGTEPLIDMLVVGSYEKHGSFDDIYCQLGAYLDPDMIFNNQSEDNSPLYGYTIDAGNFKLKNASNLNDFKNFLRNYGFSHASILNTYRIFVMLEDMKFNTTVNLLTQQIRYINVLYPVLYALLGAISLIVSYLLVVSRRKEFAMMRGLGAKKRVTFMSFFIEQGLMCIVGTLAGLGLSLLIYRALNSLQIYLITGFAVCYFIGCSISITIMNNKPVLTILKYED